ncbi:lipopolysaccharide biosynthesis protein [Thermus islandicus]|uniref:lipopolysaccharide biosynthesis protein n=1 Tax=Thermus islandicus TaxID=540988 RepID=UPI0012ECB46C|nr:hypothetical protein [Thermus islandicus]
MLVYGSGRFREAFSAYQAVLIRYHWRFGLLVFIAFLLLGGLFWSLKGRELALSFFGLSIAAPAVLYLWLVRRGAYVYLNPRLAALGGGLYLFLYLALAGFLLRARLLNEVTAFLAMALGSALAAEAIRWRLRGSAPTQVAPSEVWVLHWDYGRWALLAGALSWVQGNLYFLVLSTFHDLEATAAFRAINNLVMPIHHFNGALGQLLLPGMVRARQAQKLERFAWLGFILLLTFSLIYWIFLVLVANRLVEAIYLGKYAEYRYLIDLVGLIPVISAAIYVFSARLQALEKPRILAEVYGVSAAVATGLSLALVIPFGVPGAVEANLVANTLTALFLAWICRRIC